MTTGREMRGGKTTSAQMNAGPLTSEHEQNEEWPFHLKMPTF